MVAAENRQRKSVNVILPGLLYQRAKILTWPREEKLAFLQELNIKLVVNFWPKIDPDLGEFESWYWHLPNRRSIGMLDDIVIHKAKLLSDLLRKHQTPTLILCEAGKTRSVFFSALVTKFYQGSDFSFVDALKHIETTIPKHKMKKFMIEWLETQ